jgi:dihydropyrimidinase
MLRALVGRGITSCKVYLAYEGLALSDRELFRTLRAARELGLTVVGHCENQGLIEELQRQLLAEGKTGPAWHYWSRPPFVEAAGVHHLCAFSQAHGAGLYIAHTTCRAALEEATRARERGVPVAVETCIQYLLLDKSYAERPDFEGAKYVVSPPLRGPEDRDALWAGLSGGAVATVATDHAPTDFASQKSLGRGDFTKIPGGVPGIQDRVRLLFTHGVAAGRLSLERFVQVAATRPAELFGLYPRKGTLRAGSDADVVVFDPRPESVISAQTHAMNVDYSAYEGWRVKGSFDLVTVRGAVAVQEGRFVGRADRGQFVPRQAVAS